MTAGSKLRGILSEMTVADKVGQLLMASLDLETLEENIGRYRCGSFLVWGNIREGTDMLNFEN